MPGRRGRPIIAQLVRQEQQLLAVVSAAVSNSGAGTGSTGVRSTVASLSAFAGPLSTATLAGSPSVPLEELRDLFRDSSVLIWARFPF